jgi:hypothetical protein
MLRNKAQYYAAQACGECGNSMRVWTTAQELLSSGYTGLVGVRCVGRPGLPYLHHLTVQEAVRQAGDLSCEFRFQEASQDEFIIGQGEVMHTWRGYHLLLSRACAPMRVALAQERRVFDGLSALVALRELFWPSSMADLEDMFLHYPDHVIEFTAYSICVGHLKGRNVCLWEVRSY